MTNGYHVPDTLSAVAGRITDVDSHESVPVRHWVDEFGEASRQLAEALGNSSLPENAPVDNDDADINLHNIWKLKGGYAPGSFDFSRRLEVLNYVGIGRQMLFPGALGLVGQLLYTQAQNTDVLSTITGDRKAYARSVLDAYNDWCIRRGKVSERIRPVGILVADTAEDLLKEAKRLVDNGLRGVMIMAGNPPAGHSPAHPALDPLWKFLAEADVPVLLHVGGEGSFLKNEVWREAPAFEGYKAGGEFNLDPWTLSTLHLASQNFTATMVIGGVFERHPNLRFGSIEVGAYWIGPLSETLDLWHAHWRKFEQKGSPIKVLSMKPSDYIRRNVRVSAFDIEPVDKYIRDYGLESTYCFATDFPHHEGGKQPMTDLGQRLAPLGPEILEKFFVTNGELLLPS